MSVACLFSCMACVALKTLHFERHIIDSEDCRGVGNAGALCLDELVLVLAVKSPRVVQQAEEILKKHTKTWIYDGGADEINSKL